MEFRVDRSVPQVLSRHSLARRYFADAAYWLYLAHLPLVMALQVSLSQLAWPWWVKFPMILAIDFPILFVSYHLFVRYSFIGVILNGRREMPRGPLQDLAALPAGGRRASADAQTRP